MLVLALLALQDPTPATAYDERLFGSLVRALGDIDGDGAPDLLIGDPAGAGPETSPAAWIVSGRTGAELRAILPGDGSSMGVDLFPAGDFDGDGHADLVESELGVKTRVRWFSGADFRRLDEFSLDDPFELVPDLDGDGVAELREIGDTAHCLRLRDHNPLRVPVLPTAKKCALGPDWDRDGTRDFIVEDVDLRVLSGADLHELVRAPRGTVTWLEDLDEDAVPEWVVLEHYTATLTSELMTTDAVVVRSGRTGDHIHSFWKSSGGHFGARMIRAGDVDGDGISELAMSEGESMLSGGQVELRSGRTREQLWLLKRSGDHVCAPGATAIPCDKAPTLSPMFGSRLVALGDIDGDGAFDFAIGDGGWEPSGSPAGWWIVSGKDAHEVHAFHADALKEFFPRTLAAAGDVDGDGSADLWLRIGKSESEAIVMWSGAQRAVVRDATDAERQHVRTRAPLTHSIGDFDGDGKPERLEADTEWGVAQGRVALRSSVAGSELWSAENGMFWHFGSALEVIGDFDADGVRDWIVGGYHGRSHHHGLMNIRSGRDGALLASITRRERALVVRR